MNNIPTGQRYSLLYMPPTELTKDSKRFRRRLIKCFEAEIGDPSFDFGQVVEQELGIEILVNNGFALYVQWDTYLKHDLRDLLDTITLVGRYVKNKKSLLNQSRFIDAIGRIFKEEGVAYRIDAECGIHPSVDATYRANISSTIRGLGVAEYAAAQGFVVRADDSMMPGGDRREAIRAVFDAVENLFKMTFQGATSLNKLMIQNHLKPHIERVYIDTVAKRAALKFCEALIDWADACHNYRHAPGEAEPTVSPEELTVALVSQGYAYVRWLADVRRQYSSNG